MADSEKSMPQNQDDNEIMDTEVCDNHPGRPAVLNSDLDGAVQPIHLCEECVSTSASLKSFL